MDLFQQIVLLITAAVFGVAIARRVMLPSILGYIAVGTLVGPNGLGWIPNYENFYILAEFGIVFLMFTIGLEFSLPKMMALYKILLGLGGLQVLLTTLAAFIVAKLIGLNSISAFVVASALALSSTAITLKQLNEQDELHLRHGRLSVGILLFQDLAAIIFLVMINTIANPQGSTIWLDLLVAVGKGVGLLIVMLFVGRWVLRPALHEIAKAKFGELFMLSALLVTVTSAWISELFGLSMIFGAFIAGIILGETEYKHQLDADIRPFRDVLLGLFFITVGMLLNLRALPHYWYWILLLVVVLMIFKTLLIFAITRYFAEKDNRIALRTGIALANNGEFGFAILALATVFNILPVMESQIVLGAIVISMLLGPILIRYNNFIALQAFPITGKEKNKPSHIPELYNHTETLQDHVIICGFGRVAQVLVKFLQTESIPSVALDLDPNRIAQAKLAGEKLFYGDASKEQILEAAGIKHAKTLVISFDNYSASIKIINMVRKNYPNIPILVRTRDESRLKELLDCGANEVIAETMETALTLSLHMLLHSGVDKNRAFNDIWLLRQDKYSSLEGLIPSSNNTSSSKIIKAIYIDNKSPMLGVTFAEITQTFSELKIKALIRGKKRTNKILADDKIKAGDTLIVFGKRQSIIEFENKTLG